MEMNSPKSIAQGLAIVCVAALLAGCGEATPAATPTPASPVLPHDPPPLLKTPLPPMPSPTAKTTGQKGLLKFISTTGVTPDSEFLTGGFARINYVPATDRFVVTFGGS